MPKLRPEVRKLYPQPAASDHRPQVFLTSQVRHSKILRRSID